MLLFTEPFTESKYWKEKSEKLILRCKLEYFVYTKLQNHKGSKLLYKYIAASIFSGETLMPKVVQKNLAVPKYLSYLINN